MSPTTDRTQATANTLAIIQGRESLSSLIDELDYAQYYEVYQSADELNRVNMIALRVNNQYQVTEHKPTWTRRVR